MSTARDGLVQHGYGTNDDGLDGLVFALIIVLLMTVAISLFYFMGDRNKEIKSNSNSSISCCSADTCLKEHHHER